MSDPYDLIDVIQCEDAKDFLASISPFGRIFGSFSKPIGWWVFRGHGSEKFELLPSAYRRECQLRLAELAGIEDWDSDPYMLADGSHTVGAQCFIEANAIHAFLSESDRVGLAFPDDSMSLRKKLSEFKEDYARDLAEGYSSCRPWMPFELIAFAGIAQHHRVPTQLLDWSISPYSAAYFAASDAIDFRDRNDPCQSDLIHVYSLNATSLERKPRSVKSDLTMGIPNYSDVLKDTAQMIQPVSVPRASNKNFQAQSGVFTKLNTLRLDRNIFTSTGNSFVPQSYEQLLANLKHPATSICPLLFKFVLPASEASHVLWLLDKLGVNYASQFPSFDSAAKSMFESAKIRKAVFGV